MMRGQRDVGFFPLARLRERVASAGRRETGEGLRALTLTLPALCAGPLPLPQAVEGLGGSR
jgi:hypothetical protein